MNIKDWNGRGADIERLCNPVKRNVINARGGQAGENRQVSGTLPMDEALRFLLMLEDPKQEIPEKLKVNLSDKESEQK